MLLWHVNNHQLFVQVFCWIGTMYFSGAVLVEIIYHVRNEYVNMNAQELDKKGKGKSLEMFKTWHSSGTAV